MASLLSPKCKRVFFWTAALVISVLFATFFWLLLYFETKHPEDHELHHTDFQKLKANWKTNSVELVFYPQGSEERYFPKGLKISNLTVDFSKGKRDFLRTRMEATYRGYESQNYMRKCQNQIRLQSIPGKCNRADKFGTEGNYFCFYLRLENIQDWIPKGFQKTTFTPNYSERYIPVSCALSAWGKQSSFTTDVTLSPAAGFAKLINVPGDCIPIIAGIIDNPKVFEDVYTRRELRCRVWDYSKIRYDRVSINLDFQNLEQLYDGRRSSGVLVANSEPHQDEWTFRHGSLEGYAHVEEEPLEKDIVRTSFSEYEEISTVELTTGKSPLSSSTLIDKDPDSTKHNDVTTVQVTTKESSENPYHDYEESVTDFNKYLSSEKVEEHREKFTTETELETKRTDAISTVEYASSYDATTSVTSTVQPIITDRTETINTINESTVTPTVTSSFLAEVKSALAADKNETDTEYDFIKDTYPAVTTVNEESTMTETSTETGYSSLNSRDSISSDKYDVKESSSSQSYENTTTKMQSRAMTEPSVPSIPLDLEASTEKSEHETATSQSVDISSPNTSTASVDVVLSTASMESSVSSVDSTSSTPVNVDVTTEIASTDVTRSSTTEAPTEATSQKEFVTEDDKDYYSDRDVSKVDEPEHPDEAELPGVLLTKDTLDRSSRALPLESESLLYISEEPTKDLSAPGIPTTTKFETYYYDLVLPEFS